MSGLGENGKGSSKILKDFAEILSQHLSQTQRTLTDHAVRTDSKIDTLTDSINRLTEAHIESKKDSEYTIKRMERIEENQKEQGERIKTISDITILLTERVSTSKQYWSIAGGAIVSVLIAVSIAKLT